MNRLIDIFRQYRILHLVYWTWAFTGLLHQRDERFGEDNHFIDVIVIILFQMICVYTTIYWLIPRYLNKGKHAVFFIFALAATVTTAMLTTIALNLYTLFTVGRFINNSIIISISHLVDIWTVVAIFSSIVVLAQRYQADQYRKRLERERLETELNFLKAQINPHFLFNALNSIFVLIGPENKTAGNALLKFSGLLRYQLYECTESKVSLAKELDSLKNYIELAEIRNDDTLKLYYEFPEDTEGWYIAPFLLVPLVENAFKHISHYQERDNSIGIRVTLTGDRFHFSIDNTYDTGIATASKNSGIGLRNVRRRLELLYPGRHELTIEKEHGVYKLNLILDEKDNELSHS